MLRLLNYVFIFITCDEIEFCAKYNCTGGMPFYEECEATTSTGRPLRLNHNRTVC